MSWYVLSKLSDIVGIIGLPMAFFQICKIESRAKASENAINKFLILEKSSILNNIYNIIIQQDDAISEIQGMSDKGGGTAKRMIIDCRNVIASVNVCIYNMPVEHEELSEIMRQAISHIQNYIDSRDKTELREASDDLYVVISTLKQIQANDIRERMELISKK